MKVECAACQAKYQIPDERVAGRKLKIRCRKCGGAIVVRGDQLAAAAEPQFAQNASASGEWHVSIEGDQHGPYPTEQMAAMLRDGQLSWDAHVWRDGYPDWKTAGESDTVVRAVASVHDTPATGIVQPGLVHGGFEDDPTRMVAGGSVPPEVLQPVARSTFAARAAHQQSQPPHAYASQPPHAYASQPPQAYAAVAQRPVSRPPHDYAAAPAVEFGYGAGPHVSAEQAMTGERHEDSVLFSARNLQAGRPQSSPSVQQRAGYAGAEGSGLIDIRALAQLARTSQAPASRATNGSNGHTHGTNGRGRDEVFALAHQTGAFGRLDSLAPIDRPSHASSNAVPIAIVAGCAMVAVAAFLAVYITRDPGAIAPGAVVTTAAQPIALAAEAPAAATAAPAQAGAAEPADEVEAAEAEPAAEPTPAQAEDDAEPAVEKTEEPKAASAGRTGARGRSAKRNSASSAGSARATKPEPRAERVEKVKAAKEAPEASAKKEESIDDLLLADAKPVKQEKAAPTPDDDLLATPAPAKAAEPSKSRSIDDLLDGAVDGKGGDPKKGHAAAPSAALADSPSRDEVKAAMKSVEADVKACAEGQTLESPTATVAVTVSGSSGRVTGVRVTGIQGTVGSCVAKAVRGASFPKFGKPQFSINFPFRLK